MVPEVSRCRRGAGPNGQRERGTVNRPASSEDEQPCAETHARCGDTRVLDPFECLATGGPLAGFFEARGLDRPDDMAAVILTSVWRTLHFRQVRDRRADRVVPSREYSPQLTPPRTGITHCYILPSSSLPPVSRGCRGSRRSPWSQRARSPCPFLAIPNSDSVVTEGARAGHPCRSVLRDAPLVVRSYLLEAACPSVVRTR